MFNGSLRTALDTRAAFCTVFDSRGGGFAFNEFVYVYRAHVYAFSVAVAFVVVYFDYYVSGFEFFYHHFWFLANFLVLNC